MRINAGQKTLFATSQFTLQLRKAGEVWMGIEGIGAVVATGLVPGGGMSSLRGMAGMAT